jgi:hypothetical protein
MMQEDSCAARVGDLTMILVTKENEVCTNPHRAINLDGWVVEAVFTKE